MATVWLVTCGDTERNFKRRRDAVAWLIRLAHDDRQRPPLTKENAGCYHYYGPGGLVFVTNARIHKLGFPTLRRRRTRRTRASASLVVPEDVQTLQVVDAMSSSSDGLHGGDRG